MKKMNLPNKLTIFRMVTGFTPVESDNNSLVTFLLSPYSQIKTRQCMATEHLVLMCIWLSSPFQHNCISAMISQKKLGVNIDITSDAEYTLCGINLKITHWRYWRYMI